MVAATFLGSAPWNVSSPTELPSSPVCTVMVAFFFDTSPVTMAVRSSALDTALNPSLPSSLTCALLADADSSDAGTTMILRDFSAFSTAARLAASPGPVKVIRPTLGAAPCPLPGRFGLAWAAPGAASATARAAMQARRARAPRWARTRLAVWVVLCIRVGSGAFLRRRGETRNMGGDRSILSPPGAALAAPHVSCRTASSGRRRSLSWSVPACYWILEIQSFRQSFWA